MVERIQKQPTVRDVYAARLIDEGVVTPEEADALVAEVTATLRAAHEQLRTAIGSSAAPPAAVPMERRAAPDDGRRGRDGGRRADRLRVAQRAAPRGSRRASRSTRSSPGSSSAAARRSTDGGIDWGQAEALAYAALLEDGIPIRLSGQDAERGTFAHRHLMFHDPYTGETLRADPAPPGRQRLVRGLQLAALRVRGARVRVRLLGGGARRARALGGAVRRLRQRRADRDRPVPRRRPLEVGADLAADAAAPARLRGQRAGALERHGWSGSCSRGRRTTSGSRTARRRRSSSTCSAGRRSTRRRGR